MTKCVPEGENIDGIEGIFVFLHLIAQKVTKESFTSHIINSYGKDVK
jgi:hypothetical protein